MDYIEKLNLQSEEVEEVESLEKHTIINSEPFSVNKYNGHTRKFLALDGEYNDGFEQLKETNGLGISCIVSKEVKEAREDVNGVFHTKLKDRIDSEVECLNTEIVNINSSLDNKAKKINYNFIDGFCNCVAHRGLNGLEIENSRQAFEQAKKHGFKYVECDVQSSTDGIMYIFHDWDCTNNTNGTGVFTWKSSNEIESLYYDTGKNIEKYPNTKILKLEEAIKLFVELNVIPFIELKPQANNYKNMIDEVIRICKKHNLINYLIVVADDLSCEYLKELKVDVPIIRLTSKSVDEEIEIVKSFKCGIYGIDYANLTEELTNKIHNEGIKIATYTVNNMIDYRKLKALNIEFIITDIVVGGDK